MLYSYVCAPLRRELKKALKLLIDLNHEVWKHTSNPVPRVAGCVQLLEEL